MQTIAQHVWRLYGGVFSDAVLLIVVLWFYKSGIVPAFLHLSERTLTALGVVGILWIAISTGLVLAGKGTAVGDRSRSLIEYLTSAMYRLLRTGTVRAPKPGYERTSVLLFFVKAFFLPVMVEFMFGNASQLRSQATALLQGDTGSLVWLSSSLIPLALTFMIFIDVSYFVLGYAIESKRVDNVVRSVEPTLLGWLVTLMCYPPFNGLSGELLGSYHSDSVQFMSPWLTFVGSLIALFLFGIYVAATMALGLKCSNLTNRGTVARGPYRAVRHPAYASKVLAWWISVLPLLSPVVFVSMAAWTLVYGLRAYTEERHLSQDPEYRAYQKAVPYRFIPGVF